MTALIGTTDSPARTSDSPAGLSLGARLYRERMQRGWSSETTATYLGVSQGSYSKWETGRTMPAGDRIAAVAKFLSAPTKVVEWWKTGLLTGEPGGYPQLLARIETLEAELAKALALVEVIARQLDISQSQGRLVERPTPGASSPSSSPASSAGRYAAPARPMTSH